MSTPVNHLTAKIGARVIVRTANATYRGVLVGATEVRASVKCDDGKRRSVPWVHIVSSGWDRRRQAVRSIYMLSDEEAWIEKLPALSTMTLVRSWTAIEVPIASVATDEFRADLDAPACAVPPRPPGTATVAHAVNHWPVAINVHARNHAETTHHLESVWLARPSAIQCRPRLLWLSPDCTHHSRARGGKPRAQGIRSLAFSAMPWAREKDGPLAIFLENVQEFEDWGPLHRTHSNRCHGERGRPCPHPVGGCHFDTPIASRKGQTFRAWVRKLERYGYHVEHRVLAACDYGAPTTRRRLYVVARRDGAPRWPTPTHGPGCAQPWRTAAEVIDWSIPLPSIFGREKPLAEATLARIARGIKRFVLDEKRPFLVHVGNGERVGQAPRIYDLQRPLGTVVAGGVKQALVACYLARHFGGRGTVGSAMTEPLRTVTAQDHHALVGAFLAQHEVDAGALQIVDIGMRLLTPRELARAQGFPDDYVIEHGADGKRITRTDQVRLIGNSVCPPVARAIVEANR